MIVTTKELFKAAYEKFAVGAYNINNLEQCMGLFRGNVDSEAPFIIQISKGARSYTDKRMLEAIIRAADEVFPESRVRRPSRPRRLRRLHRLHRERVLLFRHDRRVRRALRREHPHHQGDRRPCPRQGHRRGGGARTTRRGRGSTCR